MEAPCYFMTLVKKNIQLLSAYIAQGNINKISVSTEKCSGFRVYALGCQFFTAKCSGLRV
jgi:hypothetical protein